MANVIPTTPTLPTTPSDAAGSQSWYGIGITNGVDQILPAPTGGNWWLLHSVSLNGKVRSGYILLGSTNGLVGQTYFALQINPDNPFFEPRYPLFNRLINTPLYVAHFLNDPVGLELAYDLVAAA